MASLMQLIAALSGQNDVQGGPSVTIDPKTGQQVFTYNPFTAKKGFLSNWGTGGDRASVLNAQIGGQAFLGQEEGKRRQQEILTTAEQNKQLEQLRATLESKLGKEKADQIMEELILRQNLDVLNRGDIPYDKQTAEVYKRALTDPRIANLLAQEKVKSEVLTSPQGQKAAVLGGIAQNLAPVMANQRMSEIMAGPNTSGVFTKFDVANPLGTPQKIVGPQLQQTVTQTGGTPYTDEATGQTSILGGKATATSGYTPGGVFPFAKQSSIDKAIQLYPGNPSDQNPASQSEDNRLKQLMELLRQNPNLLRQLGGTNAPAY